MFNVGLCSVAYSIGTTGSLAYYGVPDTVSKDVVKCLLFDTTLVYSILLDCLIATTN
jgi:hypothetical protein